MTEESKKRQKNETIKDWLKRTSIKDNSWIKIAKRRKKYEWFYDFIFRLELKYIYWKKRNKRF